MEVSQITARMAAVPGSKLKTVRSALGALYEEVDAPTIADQLREEQERQSAEAEQDRRMEERARRAALLRLTTVGGA